MPSYCKHSFKDLCRAAHPNNYKIYETKLMKAVDQNDRNKQVKELVKAANWFSKPITTNMGTYEAFSKEKF